jgi:hypothetical protein
LLLYAEGAFIQLLEGSREDVLETYYAINQDERHKNIIKLVNAPAEERAFSKWSMGFVTVAPERLKKLEAYINPDSELFDKDAAQHPAVVVLKAFAESNSLSYSL